MAEGLLNFATPMRNPTPVPTQGAPGAKKPPPRPIGTHTAQPPPAVTTPQVDPVGSEPPVPASSPAAPPAVGSGPVSHKPIYDPNKPIYAGPEVQERTSYVDNVNKILADSNELVDAAGMRAKEGFGGQGLLFSDIAARGEQGARIDKAMELAAPDTQFAQREAEGEREFSYKTLLGEQAYVNETDLNAQMQKYSTETRESIQEFTRGTQAIENEFTQKIQELKFAQELEGGLLSGIQGLLRDGNSAITSLAMSGEATRKEVEAIQESIRNALTTYTNVWKASANSKDSFDFSGAI